MNRAMQSAERPSSIIAGRCDAMSSPSRGKTFDELEYAEQRPPPRTTADFRRSYFGPDAINANGETEGERHETTEATVVPPPRTKGLFDRPPAATAAMETERSTTVATERRRSRDPRHSLGTEVEKAFHHQGSACLGKVVAIQQHDPGATVAGPDLLHAVVYGDGDAEIPIEGEVARFLRVAAGGANDDDSGGGCTVPSSAREDDDVERPSDEAGPKKPPRRRTIFDNLEFAVDHVRRTADEGRVALATPSSATIASADEGEEKAANCGPLRDEEQQRDRNDDDVYLSLKNPAYRAAMFARFSKMDHASTAAGNAEAANEVFGLLRKEGRGRFFQPSRRESNGYVRVDECAALKKIKSDIHLRRKSSRHWLERDERIVWAREEDRDGATEHAAFLLPPRKRRRNAPDFVWVQWASNGTVAEIPRSCVSEGLSSRRRRGRRKRRRADPAMPAEVRTSTSNVEVENAAVRGMAEGGNHAGNGLWTAVKKEEAETDEEGIAVRWAGVKSEDTDDEENDFGNANNESATMFQYRTDIGPRMGAKKKEQAETDDEEEAVRWACVKSEDTDDEGNEHSESVTTFQNCAKTSETRSGAVNWTKVEEPGDAKMHAASPPFDCKRDAKFRQVAGKKYSLTSEANFQNDAGTRAGAVDWMKAKGDGPATLLAEFPQFDCETETKLGRAARKTNALASKANFQSYAETSAGAVDWMKTKGNCIDELHEVLPQFDCERETEKWQVAEKTKMLTFKLEVQKRAESSEMNSGAVDWATAEGEENHNLNTAFPQFGYGKQMELRQVDGKANALAVKVESQNHAETSEMKSGAVDSIKTEGDGDNLQAAFPQFDCGGESSFHQAAHKTNAITVKAEVENHSQTGAVSSGAADWAKMEGDGDTKLQTEFTQLRCERQTEVRQVAERTNALTPKAAFGHHAEISETKPGALDWAKAEGRGDKNLQEASPQLDCEREIQLCQVAGKTKALASKAALQSHAAISDTKSGAVRWTKTGRNKHKQLDVQCHASMQNQKSVRSSSRKRNQPRTFMDYQIGLLECGNPRAQLGATKRKKIPNTNEHILSGPVNPVHHRHSVSCNVNKYNKNDVFLSLKNIVYQDKIAACFEALGGRLEKDEKMDTQVANGVLQSLKTAGRRFFMPYSKRNTECPEAGEEYVEVGEQGALEKIKSDISCRIMMSSSRWLKCKSKGLDTISQSFAADKYHKHKSKPRQNDTDSTVMIPGMNMLSKEACPMKRNWSHAFTSRGLERSDLTTRKEPKVPSGVVKGRAKHSPKQYTNINLTPHKSRQHISKSNKDKACYQVNEGHKPALIVTNWVQCDNITCPKWRKLPSHIDVDALPEHFVCKDNIWNSHSQTCKAPEDKMDKSKEFHLTVDPDEFGGSGDVAHKKGKKIHDCWI